MKFLIAFVITVASIAVGYVLSHGNLAVLWQPNELIMIFGSGLGVYILSNTGSTLKETLTQMKYLVVSPLSKKKFIQVVKVMDGLTKCYYQEGSKALEGHLEDPATSSLFTSHPLTLKDTRATKFISDNFRLVTNNDFDNHEISELLDIEIEKYAHEMKGPSHALDSLGDTMPGLGIVVAVLGIIISMGFIDSDPAVLGEHISAALFGTFIGIFAAYGLFKPVASYLGNISDEQAEFYHLMKLYVISVSDKDKNPRVIQELAHKMIPPHYKVSLEEIREGT